MTPIDLDNPYLYPRLDPQGLGQRLRETPQDCLRGWREAQEFPLPSLAGVRRVLILGMGGSAIGGGFLEALAPFPVQVCRELRLPPGVAEDTLVIAVSYSGDTEETLMAFDQALELPVPKLALAGGGRLAESARQRGVPLFHIRHPGPPRAALGYCTLALAGLLGKLGLPSLSRAQVEEVADSLQAQVEELDITSASARNPAKALARKLYGRIIVVYGGGFLAPVARRWKAQLNENSKAWAFFEVLPELGHNAVAGYESPRALARVSMTVLLLHSPDLEPRLRARYQGVEELLEGYGITHERVEAPADKSALGQMMGLALLGDYVSYYLAHLYQVSPWPVEAIGRLKRRLANPPSP